MEWTVLSWRKKNARRQQRTNNCNSCAPAPVPLLSNTAQKETKRDVSSAGNSSLKWKTSPWMKHEFLKQKPPKPDRTANQLELVTYYPFWSSKFRYMGSYESHAGKTNHTDVKTDVGRQDWERYFYSNFRKEQKRKYIKSILVNVCAYKS